MIKKPTSLLLLLIFLTGAGVLWLTLPASSQAAGWRSFQAPEDPLLHGAWLYQGNCVACHGLYEKERFGRGLEGEELAEQIAGTGQRGCRISWSTRRGGPFSKKEIDAVVFYILTWEDLGHEPDLPELPPQPTPTATRPVQESGNTWKLETSTPLPTKAIDPVVLIAIKGSQLAEGAYLYTQNCHRCHLTYDFARVGMGRTAKNIQHTIETGKSGTSMLGFARKNGGTLSAREIRAITGYIMAFEQLEEQPALPDILFVPPTPDPARMVMSTLPAIQKVPGDPESGDLVFAVHCTNCHGDHGQGASGPDLTGRDWGSMRPDLTIRAVIQQGVGGSAMPAWGQANGGPLSDAQINDLTVLILTWSTAPPAVDVLSHRDPPSLPLLLLGGVGIMLTAVGMRLKKLA